MSIGNTIDEGNKGRNFPFQYKMLLGLQKIADSVKLPTSIKIIPPTPTVQVPTVSAVPVTTWDAAVDFTSDAMSFAGRGTDLPWGLQITDYNITGGNPRLTIEISSNGSNWDVYKPFLAKDIDMSDVDNRAIYDSIMPYNYMRFVYVSNGATGDFSLKMQK